MPGVATPYASPGPKGAALSPRSESYASDAPPSPIQKSTTSNDAIPTFTRLASSKDIETLHSMLTGLAKLARKGWQSQIHANGGTAICLKNMKHMSPRVFAKA